MVAFVPTVKKRMSLYLEEETKDRLEVLARIRKRSVSNLIEVLCEEAIEAAIKSGEIGDCND